MRVSSVSERDQRWEVPFPTSRVYFWENPGGHPLAWTSYPYEITHYRDDQGHVRRRTFKRLPSSSMRPVRKRREAAEQRIRGWLQRDDEERRG